MNITIDDTSPQFQWLPASNGWAANNTADPIRIQYYDTTFHSTCNDGDSVQFTFNGSAIYMYGSKRANHGTYSAQLDSGNIEYYSGYSRDDDLQALLYVAGGLASNQEHTIRLTNLPSLSSPPGNASIQWYLNIDHIIVTAPLSNYFTTILDDSDPAFSWHGASWATKIDSATLSRFHNDSLHTTTTSGDTVQLSFIGNFVQLFGARNNDHGNYTISLDGGAPIMYNSTEFQLQTNVSLYLASNLGEGPHTLVVNNTKTKDGFRLSLDYAVILSASPPPTAGSAASTLIDTTTATSSARSISTAAETAAGHASAGTIASSVIGSMAGLAILVALVLLWLRRQRVPRLIRYAAPMDLSAEPKRSDDSDREGWYYRIPGSSASDAPRSDQPQSSSGSDLQSPHTPYRVPPPLGSSWPSYLYIPPCSAQHSPFYVDLAPSSTTTQTGSVSSHREVHADIRRQPSNYAYSAAPSSQLLPSPAATTASHVAPRPRVTPTSSTVVAAVPASAVPSLKSQLLSMEFSSSPGPKSRSKPRQGPPSSSRSMTSTEDRLNLGELDLGSDMGTWQGVGQMGTVQEGEEGTIDGLFPPNYRQATEPMRGGGSAGRHGGDEI